jgi:hypothetical protein
MNARLIALPLAGVLAMGAAPAVAKEPAEGAAGYKLKGGLATKKVRYYAPAQQVVMRGRVTPAVPGEVLALASLPGYDYEPHYVQVDGQWLISETTAASPAECVPPSIDDAVTESWETFTAAWREWERTGGDADELVDLVTEDHAAILRSLGEGDWLDQI